MFKKLILFIFLVISMQTSNRFCDKPKQQNDIPQDIIESFQQSYDKPTHTSGMYTSQGYLPLQSIHYDVEIYGSVSKVSIQQEFYNDFDYDIDIQYIFAVSPNASFIGLTAEINNHVLVGTIKEKNIAKQEYYKAIKEGKTAAISEILQGLHDIMNLKIGNLPKGQKCIIKYQYVEKLEIAINKFWRYYIPTNISPRSTSQTASYLQSQNTNLANQGSNISDNTSNNVPWTIEIKYYYDKEIGKQDLQFVKSPTHEYEIMIIKQDDYTQITLDPSKIHYPTKPFELLYRNSQINQPQYLLENLQDDEQFPYAAEISFFPEFNTENVENAYKNYQSKNQKEFYQVDTSKLKGQYVFILDRSESMHGDTIETAKDTLTYLIEQIPEDSYIDIVSFGSSYQSMFGIPQKSNENPKKVDAEELDLTGEQLEELQEQQKNKLTKKQEFQDFIKAYLCFFALFVSIIYLNQYFRKKYALNKLKKEQKIQQMQQYAQNQQNNQHYQQQQQQQQYNQYQNLQSQESINEQFNNSIMQQKLINQQELNQNNNNSTNNNSFNIKQDNYFTSPVIISQIQEQIKCHNILYQMCQAIFFIIISIVILLFIVFLIPMYILYSQYSYSSSYYALQSYDYSLLDPYISTKQNALQQIKYMDSDFGGTEIQNPLEYVFLNQKNFPYKEEYPLNVFLITDGAVWGTDEIISLIKQQTSQNTNTRLYTVGIGRGADLSLIIQGAKAGNGLYEYVSNINKMKNKIDYLLKDSMTPFINNYTITYSNPQIVEIAVPKQETMPILRRNQAFNLSLLLNEKLNFEDLKIELKYYNSLIQQEQSHILIIKSKNATQNNFKNKPIHSIIIKKLLDSLLFNAVYNTNSVSEIYQQNEIFKPDSVMNQSIELSTKYQVLSEFTSFILIDQENIAKQKKNQENDKQEEQNNNINQLSNENSYDRDDNLARSNTQILKNSMITLVLLLIFILL